MNSAKTICIINFKGGAAKIEQHRAYRQQLQQQFQNGKFLDCGIAPGENKAFQTVIHENSDFSQAAANLLPVSLYRPNSKGAQDYDRFTEEILQNLENDK